jgi:formyl-CoA transferase
MLDFQASRYLMDGEVAGQAGNDHPVNIPMGVFPTADKPINIAASSPKLWEAFCRAAGREDWMQVPEWKTAAGRSKDRVRVNAAVSEVTRTKPSEWWIETLEAAGIPCGPINDIREVFEDPQVQHLEMAMPLRHRRRGDTRIVASPLKIEGLRTGVYRDVPGLGEHGAEILAEAGLSAAEIEDLKSKGALGGE